MNITVEDLIELINEARKGIDICTPRIDYYSRSNDWSEEYLEYVCPQLLISNLQKFIEDNKK